MEAQGNQDHSDTEDRFPILGMNASTPLISEAKTTHFHSRIDLGNALFSIMILEWRILIRLDRLPAS